MKFNKYLNNVLRVYSAEYPDNFLRLHSSERDEDFPEKLLSEFKKKINQQSIKFYPNISKTYKKLIKFYKLNKNFNLILGDGSDRIIKYCFECFTEKNSKVITTSPCFPMYEVYSNLYQTKLSSIKIKKPKIDINNIILKLNKNTSLIILSNPLSPYGFIIKDDDLEYLAKKAKTYGAILVVDEAYIEFSNKNSFLKKCVKKNISNVIIIKTFSKALGSAGIRVGLGIGNTNLIERISKFRAMHEITSLSDIWVNTILDNYQIVDKYINRVIENKLNLLTNLGKIGYLELIDSYSNWIFVRSSNSNLKKKFNSNKIAIKSGICIPWIDKKNSWFKVSIPADKSNLKKLIDTLR